MGVGDMYLTSTDPSANPHRHYRMDMMPGLFGDWGLVREWGRVGRSGQVRTDCFQSEADAKHARFALHVDKLRRGYT